MAECAQSIEKQIEILKERGLIIEDETKAKEILNDIGYYRLSFYWNSFEKKIRNSKRPSHKFKKHTSFNDIVDLYYFDNDLRMIFNKYITRIEVNLRNNLIYTVSMYYINNPFWFVDSKIIDKPVSEMLRNDYKYMLSHNPPLRYHHNYHPGDKYAPAWKTLEFLAIGAIQKIYENINDETLKKLLCEKYNIKHIRILYNYIEAIRSIRNTCAHGKVLYKIKLPQSICKGPAGHISIANNSTIQGGLAVILFFLKQISINRANEFVNDLTNLERTHKKLLKRISFSFFLENICK